MSTKIVCHALDCIFNEGKTCISEEIVYEPEEGCLTYEVLDDLVELEEEEEEWEDDELFDEEEDDDELEWDDNEEDLFDDDEDEF
jgi:hypothetical protein